MKTMRLVQDVPYSAVYHPKTDGHEFTQPSQVVTEGYLSPKMKMKLYHNAGINLQEWRNKVSQLPYDSDLFENGVIPDFWTPDVPSDMRLDITEVVDSVRIPTNVVGEEPERSEGDIAATSPEPTPETSGT